MQQENPLSLTLPDDLPEAHAAFMRIVLTAQMERLGHWYFMKDHPGTCVKFKPIVFDPQTLENLEGLRAIALDLSHAQLAGAKLNNAKIQHANLSGCNLTGAELNQTKIYSTSLGGASLQQACLNGASISQSHMLNANLQGATLQRVHMVSVKGMLAAMPGVDMTDARLVSCILPCDMTGSRLVNLLATGCDFGNANFTDADLTGADLKTSKLPDVDLNNADLTATQLPVSIFRAQNIDKAKGLNTANFWMERNGRLAKIVGIAVGSDGLPYAVPFDDRQPELSANFTGKAQKQMPAIPFADIAEHLLGLGTIPGLSFERAQAAHANPRPL